MGCDERPVVIIELVSFFILGLLFRHDVLLRSPCSSIGREKISSDVPISVRPIVVH